MKLSYLPENCRKYIKLIKYKFSKMITSRHAYSMKSSLASLASLPTTCISIVCYIT